MKKWRILNIDGYEERLAAYRMRRWIDAQWKMYCTVCGKIDPAVDSSLRMSAERHAQHTEFLGGLCFDEDYRKLGQDLRGSHSRGLE